MAETHLPLPLKFLIAVIYREKIYLDRILSQVISSWGEIDFLGNSHPFDVTDYYRAEMGNPLFRKLITLKKLHNPENIVHFKRFCNGLESKMKINGNRTVNLDAGYLDHNKLVLASAKEAGHKIYLSEGIYADLIAKYKQNNYRTFEWSFPDFKADIYQHELLQIRKIYLKQIKIWKYHNFSSEVNP